MKILLLTFFIGFVTISIAQTPGEIVGDWQFYTVKSDADTPTEKLDRAAALINSMVLKLNADKTYSMAFMGLSENGKWELKEKKIEFTTSDEKSYGYDILSFEKNLLTLDQKKFAIVLSRVGAKVPPPHSEPKSKKTYVTACTPQLTKKWFLKSCPAPENFTDAQKDAYAEMLSGSYIEFKTNGKCTLQLGDKKETGQWNLNPDKNGITTTLKNLPTAMYLIKINATDLVITEADSYDDWIFSAVE